MLSLVESIRDARRVALVEEGVVNSGSNDTAHNRGEDRHDEVVISRAEDLSSVHDGRKKSGTQVSSRVDSLKKYQLGSPQNLQK